MNYCEFIAALPNDTDNPNKHYHDKQYGFPISDDNELFGRLVLESIRRVELDVDAEETTGVSGCI